jgi:hypothetical protein
VNKIGIDAATATGVIYYKPYAVCAMRVACVLWGTGVSIFWTYLPFPITARSLMRKHLATSQPYELWRTLQRYDPQILDARHVPELGYSTYAVVEVLSGVSACKTNELVRSIEQLVGVTTFDIDDFEEMSE